MNEIEQIASKFGLIPDELRDLLRETDDARGVLTAADLDQGLRSTVATLLGVFGVVADRVEDPADRLVVGRYLAQATEALVDQLSAAPHRPN